MKIIYTLLIVSGISFSGSAQVNTPQMKAAVKAATTKMDNALMQKDYATFMQFAYPKVIEMTEGGVPRMIADLKRQVDNMAAAKNEIIKVWPGNAGTIIDTAGELQCTIPQYMTIQLDNGKMTSETTLIGISPNKGKNWYFIDAIDRDNKTMRGIFPNLSSKLVLKKSPEPVFEESR